MRVLHINNTTHTGGAARAMRRLSMALKKKGHQSQILVGRSKYPEDQDIHLIWDEVRQFRSLPNSLRSRIGNQIEKYIGIHPWANRLNFKITDTELYDWADIIELRNLFGGYFNFWSLPSVTAGKPVVWRLPDLWAVTGHCAFPYDCDRWITGCYKCPLLTPEGRKNVEPPPTVLDGTRRVWRVKKSLYDQSPLHIVVNSKWMHEQVSRSIIKKALSVDVISNGVELDIYKPRDKQQARSKLGLPADAKIMLSVSHRLGAYRKGFQFASKAMEFIQEKDPQATMFVTMGSQERWNQPKRLRKSHHFGYVKDPEKQALIYAAADAFLCTSLAEGQPQTALESMACGTPVIAFDVGPMPEEVIDSKTGFIVPNQNVEALVSGIERFLENENIHINLQKNCRQQAIKKYDLDKQTDKYISLYEGILENYRNYSSYK